MLEMDTPHLTDFERPKAGIRIQVLPAPDEAPLTWCPWCGKEYCTLEETSDYMTMECSEEGVYPTYCEDCEHYTDFCNIPARHSCGGLVEFVDWAS